MTDKQLAFHLGKALQGVGKIEGAVLAMRDVIVRELGDVLSSEFYETLNAGLRDIESNIEDCYDAIGETIELETDD